MTAEFLLSISVFVVGAFAGGSMAWFARGVLDDVRHEDEAIDRRVRAQK